MIAEPITILMAMVAVLRGTQPGLEAQPANLSRLFTAVCAVESGGNTHALNSSTNAAGVVQIRPCVVKDCNQIVGERRWTLRDRYDRARSREMFVTYLKFYGDLYKEQTGRQPTAETYARMWNGGPTGWRKASTREYWRMVKAHGG
jgi:hypothetical protein